MDLVYLRNLYDCDQNVSRFILQCAHREIMMHVRIAQADRHVQHLQEDPPRLNQAPTVR